MDSNFLLRLEAAEKEVQHAKESTEMAFEVIRALRREANECINTANKDTQNS